MRASLDPGGSAGGITSSYLLRCKGEGWIASQSPNPVEKRAPSREQLRVLRKVSILFRSPTNSQFPEPPSDARPKTCLSNLWVLLDPGLRLIILPSFSLLVRRLPE